MSILYIFKRTGVFVVAFSVACGGETTAPTDPVPAAGGPSRGLAVGSVRDAGGRSIANANVYVGTYRADATGSCASAQLAGNPMCGGAFQYEARKVTYDFAQLRRWYDRIQILTALEGWRSSDIDEVRNMIVLDYSSSAAIAAAQHALASLDVPSAAVSFAVVNGAVVR